jgi:Effector-associated domain 11
MALLETAAEYVLGIIVEDDNFKKFPKEFIGESVKWVKSWFLTAEDPKTTAKLEDPKKSIEYKKDIIDDKLEELKDNSTFMQELTAKIHAYETHKSTSLNTIDDTELDVKGSFRQGNTGGETDGESSNKAMEQNTIKRSKITVDGDFRQGDDIQTGKTIINNNYYGGAMPQGGKAPPQYSSLKNELKALVAQNKTVLVFNKLLDYLERQDERHYNTVLLLFGQYNRLNEKENGGLVSFADANIERNRLNNGLIATIDGLTFE